MFPMLPYPQVIPTMASPHSIAKHLDSVGSENLEREDILKLAKRCGIDTIRTVCRFLTKRRRGVRRLSKHDTSVLQVAEAAARIESEVSEEEDPSTADEQSDESSSVTTSEGIEESNNPPRVIYRETEHSFLMPAIIEGTKNEPAYTIVQGAIWPTTAVYNPEEYDQQPRGHHQDWFGSLYDGEETEQDPEADEFGVLLGTWA
ncbi:hypothetical protein BDY19DRAFT_1022308 [Irpex rosettiformis]|uniref:Uncharacterized protein n=1 Tax=Irpex rosettiformis TaxID=378272 RepID=A0ACB8TSQ2_9APHY|nr:hypothetical protein BDY19DRAFT_1022308 [Irpex rosettiformis]